MEPQNHPNQDQELNNPAPVEPALTEPAPTTNPPSTSAPPVGTPSVTPVKHKYRKSLIFGSILLMAAALGLLYFLSTTAKSAEKRFYEALENHLKVTTISQDYTLENESTNFSYLTQSDFTDPKKSKTKGSFTLKSTTFGVDMELEGEAVAPNPEEAYAKYSKYTLNYLEKNAEMPAELKDKWVLLPENALDDGTDPSAVIIGINTPLGEVIVGYFDESFRQEILDKVKTGQIYTIKTSEEVTEDGKNQVKYEIEINQDKLYELNQFVADKLGIENTMDKVDIAKSFTTWVDKDTDQFTKVFLRESEDGKQQDITVMIGGYGAPLTIDTPSESMTYDEFEQTMKSVLESQLYSSL